MRQDDVLLLGAGGQLGHELVTALAPLGPVIALSRDALDLRDTSAVRAAIRAARPTTVVNAAAYTAVDRAEDCEREAWAVNAVAPEVIAEETARLGATLVHFSTDYVFDGAATAPYPESAATAPLNVYGASKLAGERAVCAVGGRSLVLRVGWLYGRGERNFVATMLRLAREWSATDEPIRVVSDQRGTPTTCAFVARATRQALAHPSLRSAAPSDDIWGVYHVAAAGEATWHELATAVFAASAARGVRAPRVEPIASTDYGARARRPSFTVLDTRRAERTFGIRPTRWELQLAEAMEQRLTPSDPAPLGGVADAHPATREA